jgi:hypothetical protein
MLLRVTEAPTPRRAWARTLIFTTATAALTVCAALMMFSAFMFYDDEGYVLISLRNFAEHGGLYGDVYSQYGPFPFVFYYLLHAIGVPLTHVGGRLITVAAWTGVAVCCAAIVQRGTRNFLLTLAVLAGVFPYLWIMVSEPSHPGGLIAIGVAIAAAAGYAAIAAGHPRRWAVIAGAVAAALALTKINVGGFVVLAGLAWILLHHKDVRVRRCAAWLIAIGGIVVPLVLMRPMLAIDWVQTFALVFACAAIAAATVAKPAAFARVSWRTLGSCIASGALLAAVVLGVVFARGSSPSDVLEGVLLGPLKHPVAFNLRYTWPTGARAVALLSLLTCGIAVVLRTRGSQRIHIVVAAGRLIAAAGAAFAVLQFPAASPDRIVFGYGAACLWVFLWPLPGESDVRCAPRTWVGLLWLGQYLHAFPVAGSQIAWGTFLVVPLAALGAHEAMTWLVARNQSEPRPRAPAAIWAFRLGILALAITPAWRFGQASSRYREGSDLALPGAEFLRLPSESTALFRLLTVNANAHGDMLFSEPGMFSLNLWSGLPAPTHANVTHWFSLLSGERQQGIIASLEAHPRTCVIVQRDHINFLTQRSFAPAGPLHDYVTENFTPAIVLDDFEFRVRKGRQIDPLLLGEMLVQTDIQNAENTALKLRIVLPADRPVARVELSAPRAPNHAPLVFDATNARVEITPTDLRGMPIGPTKAAPWPFQVEGVATVVIHFDRFKLPRPVAGGLITLRGPDGSEAALARLKN